MPAFPHSRLDYRRFSCRRLVPALLLVLMLAGCDDYDSSRENSPQQTPAAPQAESFSGEALMRQGSVQSKAGAQNMDQSTNGADSESRIEERRGYSLEFGEAEPLVAMYREIHEACLASGDCRVEQGSLNTPRYGHANGHLTLRIARERVDSAEPVRLIAESPALSGVEVTRNDRTQQMIDTDARLAQQVVLRERLKELAEQGRGFSERRIQDLLQVERELARVQGEIESMQGQQRHLARVTDSVAITAKFQQQRWIEPRQHGALAPLWSALDHSVELFFESVGQVILVVVFLTPWLVIGVPTLWLISRLWRPLRRAFAKLGNRRRTARRGSGD